jgi:hypothetical protein
MFISIQFCDKIVIDCDKIVINCAKVGYSLFHLTDTLHLLIYFGYPLSFVQSIDTLDLLN